MKLNVGVIKSVSRQWTEVNALHITSSLYQQLNRLCLIYGLSHPLDPAIIVRIVVLLNIFVLADIQNSI